jgi:hypothetical protein
MAMKAVLDSLDGLSDDLKAHYTEVDGKFHLQVEGGEDTGALKRAKDHEKERRTKAEERATALQARIDELQEEIDGIRKGSIPKADMDALEASLNKRFDTKLAEKQAEVESLTQQLSTVFVTDKARSLATKLAAKPEFVDVLLPHIIPRLKLDTVDGAPVTRVLDAAGKPSADTLDDLEKALLQNPGFAPILRGSLASGSGANGGNGGGGASHKNLSDMSESERIAMSKSDPAGFQRLVDEDKKNARKR